jgi:hypothetical protein
VGFYDHTLTANLRTAVWHWNGSAWSVIPSPSIPSPFGFYPSVLLSIDSAGSGVLFAVGEWRIGNTWFPLAMRWNGSSWSLLSPPPSNHGDGRLRSVSARSPSDVWAVGTTDDHDGIIGGGYGEAFALHFDGADWTEVSVPQPSPWGVNPLSAVLATDDGVRAVGTWENETQGLDTFCVSLEGQAFALVPSPNVPGDGQGWNELRDITLVGGEPWAVGDGNDSFFGAKLPLVERFSDPCAESVVLAGTGTPGCAGPLEVGANSVPAIGNPGFAVTFQALPPSAPALALLGTAVDAAGTLPGSFGVLVHIDFAATSFLLPIGLGSGPAGGATLSLPIPGNPLLVGQEFVIQGFAQWPASVCQPSPSGWSSTPALVLTVQP